MSPLLILVDGHSLAYRSYYAYAKSKSGGLMTSAGVPTSICFGFVKALVEIINSQKPDSMAIAFDLRQPTFRHEADDNYKADRVETPEDFTIDIQNLYLLLTALNLPTITAPGYEADDILGTLAGRGSRAGRDGRLYFKQDYFNAKVGETLPVELFEPQTWATSQLKR